MRIRNILCLFSSLLVSAFLFGCSPPTEDSMIIKVKESSLSKISQDDAIALYEQNKKNLQALADYLLDNERLFESSPDAFFIEYHAGLITDNELRTFAQQLFSKGTFQRIWSQNDNPLINDNPGKNVHFIIGGKSNVYEQGLLFTSDPDIEKKDVTVYNEVKRYQALGGGWFYYFHHIDGVKDADRYRKAVWDRMDDKTRKSIRTDWKDAFVTLKDLNGKMVVSVCFHTDQDGLLGPITAYLDPVTAEIIGGVPRL